jgi:ABC-type taurine transport system ATPase subunit
MAPTEGYATVAGKDIRTDLEAIRKEMGICFQHDCLFPNLTVREHVQFFSRLKGLYSKVPRTEAEEHVDQSIRDVALFEKRNSKASVLSGGMKRKLSVALAFCGNSKVVLLDEPTSGMVRSICMMDPLCLSTKLFHWTNARRLLLDEIGPILKAFHMEWYVSSLYHLFWRIRKAYHLVVCSYSPIQKRSLHHIDNSPYGMF